MVLLVSYVGVEGWLTKLSEPLFNGVGHHGRQVFVVENSSRSNVNPVFLFSLLFFSLLYTQGLSPHLSKSTNLSPPSNTSQHTFILRQFHTL